VRVRHGINATALNVATRHLVHKTLVGRASTIIEYDDLLRRPTRRDAYAAVAKLLRVDLSKADLDGVIRRTSLEAMKKMETDHHHHSAAASASSSSSSSSSNSTTGDSGDGADAVDAAVSWSDPNHKWHANGGGDGWKALLDDESKKACEQSMCHFLPSDLLRRYLGPGACHKPNPKRGVP